MKRSKEKTLDIPEFITASEAESMKILDALSAEEQELQVLYHHLTTAEKIDEIAERILMLGGVPENRFSEYLKGSCVKEVGEVSCGHEAVEIVLDTYKILIEKERKLIDLANDANDAVTADMLTGYLKEQEKMVWMFVALSSHHCEK